MHGQVCQTSSAGAGAFRVETHEAGLCPALVLSSLFNGPIKGDFRIARTALENVSYKTYV